MKSRLSAAPALAPALLFLGLSGLSGCSDVAGYPSLSPRPIEREVMRAEAAPAAPPAAVAAAPVPASADIGEIVTRGEAADAAFHALIATARPKVEAGRSAAEGSEAWIVGQQAYSEVEAAIAPLTDALAELDRRRQAAIDAGNAADEAAVVDAATRLQALYEAERALLAQLMPS